ncbi:hypothetical protein FKP32DRAFT_1588402 [Trametes sanguinea]|nr:hypothetical protein FKP32DRAFT_1588402 [Trametes sanguinea]
MATDFLFSLGRSHGHRRKARLSSPPHSGSVFCGNAPTRLKAFVSVTQAQSEAPSGDRPRMGRRTPRKNQCLLGGSPVASHPFFLADADEASVLPSVRQTKRAGQKASCRICRSSKEMCRRSDVRCALRTSTDNIATLITSDAAFAGTLLERLRDSCLTRRIQIYLVSCLSCTSCYHKE